MNGDGDVDLVTCQVRPDTVGDGDGDTYGDNLVAEDGETGDIVG